MRDVPGVAHAPHRHLRVARRREALEIAAGVFVGEAAHQRRVHEPRHDAVQPDAFGGVDHRRRARELDQPGLGGAVGDLRLADIAKAGDRGHVDDRAAALALHDGQDRLAGEIDALEVDGDLLVEGRLVELDRTAGLRAADIVDEHVDPAEAPDAVLDERLDALGGRRVAARRHAGAALGLDQPPRFGGGGVIDVEAGDARALAGEQHGGRLAVAPAGPARAAAGDDRDLVLQAEHAPLPSLRGGER